MSTLKKIFIISSVLLLAILAFGGIYYFAFQEKTPKTAKEDEKKETAKLVEQKQEAPKSQPGEKIKALTEEAAIAPTITEDGNKIKYYDRSTGKVYEISFSGTGKRTISDTNLSGLTKVIWSPEKDKVISIFDKNGAAERYFYDYDKKGGVKLKDGMEYIVWTNLGDKIIYKYYDSKTKKRSLSIADPDGNDWKNLADVAWRDILIAPVPQTSLVSFWNPPNGFEETNLQTIGIAGGEAKTVFSKKFGADYLWSPNGQKALISSAETKGSSKVTLATINSNGGEYQNLNIPTVASKCVWAKDNKTLYYALPGSIPEGSVMPNDYQNKKFYTRDSFWKADTTTGKKDRIVELNEIAQNFDAAELFLSPSEDKLFFTNRADGKLYGISI